MHQYRTHTCGEINQSNINELVKLSGWINSRRNHGGLLFIDLRDQFGLTQVVIDQNNKIFERIESLKVESVICITGKVLKRTEETINNKILTGEIEVEVSSMEVLSAADVLPMQVSSNETYGDEIRLKNRFLDLRRNQMKHNILLRSDIIQFIISEL